MTALGVFVRNRRSELGLTQAELAIRMGVDDTYVSAVETGRRTPDGAPFLDILGRALELDAERVGLLFAVARRSQRTVRLPEELSPGKHAAFMAIADDLATLSERDMEVIASVHAALRRTRERQVVDESTATEGGDM
jgi:transcriptional regulator with XRE-family HTH domain